MRYGFLFAAFCLVLLTSPLSAVVVTVTPVTTNPTGVDDIVENQLTNGWSIVTNRFGIGEISPSVPSLAEAENGLNSEPWGTGVDFGRGTFYAACAYVGVGSGAGKDQTPSTVWLGLDQFGSRPQGLAGIKLNQIKTLKYYTYVSKNPSRQQPGSSPNLWDSSKNGWLFPSQPVMIQFTVGCPNPPAWMSTMYSRLQFVFRPWDGGYGVKGDPKYEDGLGVWLEYDALSSGAWMWNGLGVNQSVVPYANWTALCSAPYNLDFGGGLVYSTTFGQCELLPTTTDYDSVNYKVSVGYKSPGWTDSTWPIGWINTTGTGKPLNFVLGARRSTLRWPGETSATSWAQFESINARAQMDFFTLGIDLNGDGDDKDPGEQFTYNFEPAANDQRPTVAYLSQKDLRRGGVDRVFSRREEVHKLDNLFKVAGRVTATGNLEYSPWFEVDDGSGLAQPTRVYYGRLGYGDGTPPEAGQLWEVWGFMETPRWPWTVGTPTITLPYVIWADKSNCRRLD